MRDVGPTEIKKMQHQQEVWKAGKARGSLTEDDELGPFTEDIPFWQWLMPQPIVPAPGACSPGAEPEQKPAGHKTEELQLVDSVLRLGPQPGEFPCPTPV